MRIKRVGEANVGDDDVAVTIQKQVLELEVSVHYALFVEVANAGDELREQAASRMVFEIAMVQDVVKKLPARRVLEDDANVSIRLDHVYQAHNVGVLHASQNGDFAPDL